MRYLSDIRVANIVEESIVDGYGLRLVVFAQGCRRHCKGCHNPKTWRLNSGYKISVSKIANMMSKNPLIEGITFSGGEPLLQPKPFKRLAVLTHNMGLNVMCYTGYTFEDLLEKGKCFTKNIFELLLNIDFLVDGEFKEEERTLLLNFKGSKNQRIIDVQRSLKKGRTVVIG